MKRLGIFLVYDAHGIMDEYIAYMLAEAKKVMEDIVVVCNGHLVPEGRRLLEQYAKQIIVRENKGFDFGAWKDAMMDYIGFPVIRQYDELVLFNDSFFGPFDGFEAVFDKMESRDLDFWGLTVHGEVDTVKNMNPYGYRPRYIQTYFVVFSKRVINDFSFYNYWKDLLYFDSFLEAGEKGSAVLTKYFEDLGFSWGVYSDTTEYETTREKNVCNHAFNTLDIIKNKNYPIIKRKSFVLGKQRFLKYNSGLDLEKAVAYIEKEKNYDANLIYKHIIRRFNIQELKESMNLDFVLSAEKSDISLADYKILVCVEIKSLDYLKQIAAYLNDIDEGITIALFIHEDISESELRKHVQREFVLKTLVNGSADMLDKTIASDYDFICFINHSTKYDNDTFTVRNSYTETRWENCVISNDYIANIIQTFMDRKYLGVLVPEQSVHATTYAEGHKNRQKMINRYQAIFDALGMDCIVDANVDPVYCDGAFWCRKEAI
jgi:rhamnosyltransferase